MREKKLNEIMAKVKSFPTMPGAGAKMLALLQEQEPELTEIEAIQKIAAKGIPFVVAENMVLGTDHAEIGARILAQWNLPAEVIRAVRWHHDPESADTCGLEMDVVYLANLLCQTSETSGAAGGNAIELSPAVIDRLGIQMDQFEAISGKVAQWVDELSDALAFS